MTGADRWERVAELFEAVQELEPAKQRAYLDEHCDDPEVRAEVDSLLGEHASDGNFLEDPTHLQELDASAVAAAAGVGEVNVDQIGHYKVLEKLGEGGMGIVYRVEQENPRRMAALKVIRPGYATSELLRRFEHEAHVLGRLQHDGIARIYEAGTADLGYGPQPFFAMEYIDGPTLTEYAERAQLSTDDRLELLAKICDAVQHAHEKGVIHRDLKPGNILVAEGGQPKILDFGIARATDSDMQVTTMQTSPGQVVGTLQYMSPEQASGDPDLLDVSSDVYSLGVIGYELLSGRLPHDLSGRMIHEAVRVVAEDDPQPLSQVSNVYRGDVDTIVGKAIAREKTRRYHTALEFASDIRRYLRHEPIQARPPSSLYYLRKFAQRHKGLTASIIVVFALLCTFAVQKTIDNRRLSIVNDRLEERFKEVRAMAEEFVKLDAEIRDIVGTTSARRSLVETARDFLRKLAVEKDDDPGLLLEVAHSYELVGDVLGNPELPNLGDSEEARDCYRESLIALQRVVATGNESLTEAVARAHRNLGTMQAALGEYDEAVANYDEAARILHESTTTDPNLDREYARLQRRRGGLEARRGNFAAAGECYAEAIERMRTDVLQTLSGKPRSEAEVESHEMAIEHLEAQRRSKELSPPEVSAGFEKLTQQLRAFVEANPTNMRGRRFLARALDKMGLNLIRGSKFTEARPVYEEAIAIRKTLAKEDPRNITAQRELALGYDRIGELHYYTKRQATWQQDLETALAGYQKALETRTDLAEQDSENRDILLNLARSHELMATVLIDLIRSADTEWKEGEKEARTTDAKLHLTKCVQIRERLLLEDPGQTSRIEELAIIEQRYGQFLFVLRDFEAAIPRLERYLELSLDLAKKQPKGRGLELALAARQKIAYCYTGLKEYDRAVAMLSDAIEERRQALDGGPTPAKEAALAKVIFRLGQAFHEKGGDEEVAVAERRSALVTAHGHYQESLDLFEAQRDSKTLNPRDRGNIPYIQRELKKVADLRTELAAD